MKNAADYSQYECPYSHLEKECGHELKGPEGFEKTYGVWCACGFRGPVFYLEPEELGLKKKGQAITPPTPEPAQPKCRCRQSVHAPDSLVCSKFQKGFDDYRNGYIHCLVCGHHLACHGGSHVG